jgi:hypothetical protein
VSFWGRATENKSRKQCFEHLASSIGSLNLSHIFILLQEFLKSTQSPRSKSSDCYNVQNLLYTIKWNWHFRIWWKQYFHPPNSASSLIKATGYLVLIKNITWAGSFNYHVCKLFISHQFRHYVTNTMHKCVNQISWYKFQCENWSKHCYLLSFSIARPSNDSRLYKHYVRQCANDTSG